jgi:DNA-binding NtrC family response regulator
VTQAKLLRTLENSEVQRLGSVKPIKVDVRLVSATNRDLERCIVEGRFRQDLFFRVNGIALRIPPLRERTQEIGELAKRFLTVAGTQAGLGSVPELSPEATRALEAYAWPGNVRELRYAMERALVTAGSGPVLPEHLPPQVQGVRKESPVPEADRASRERVVEALVMCDGNQTRAAEMLGVSRRTLINRMIEFGLPRPRKGA